MSRYLGAIGVASVLLAVALAFSTGVSTMCIDDAPSDSSAETGCTTEYLIEPLGLRLGEWFGAVGAIVMTTAILSIIMGGGWLLQRLMDRKEQRVPAEDS